MKGGAMPRNRHAMIADRLADIDRERAEIAVELDGLPDQIRAARVAALRSAPSAASDGVGTEVRRLTERAEKLERRQGALLLEREALVQVQAEEEEKQREAVTREMVARGAGLREQELELWKEAGALFEQLIGLFSGKIVAVALELEALRDEARRAGLDPDAVPELAAPVRPWPVDSWAFLSMLYAAAVDPGGLGRREVGAQHAQRSDLEWRLPELVPDLRPVERVGLRNVESREVVFRA